VLLAGPENFESFVRGYGLDFHAMPGDTRALMGDSEKAKQMIWKGDDRRFFLTMYEAMRPIRQAYFDSMLESARGADLVLASPVTEFSSQAACEAAGGVPCALSYFAPQAPSAEYAAFILGLRSLGLPFLNRFSHQVMQYGWWAINRAWVNEARRRWGLKPWLGSPTPALRKAGNLTLLAYSPSLFPEKPLWPEIQKVTGAWRLPDEARSSEEGDQQDEGFVRWLEEGPPPVYFGFGSMPVPEPEAFLELAAELCEELGMRALVSAGWNELKLQACDLPDNAAVVENADHNWLFPQCAAVLHHGGAGTTHAALAAGVPSIICSFFADQPFWGRQLKRSGAGLHLPFKKLDEESLRRALEGALQEGVAQRAAELGFQVKAEQGAERAADLLIERYA
jgi:UDP:flavonoid glycosyltransferase YjiC (YdhE family)